MASWGRDLKDTQTKPASSWLFSQPKIDLGDKNRNSRIRCGMWIFGVSSVWRERGAEMDGLVTSFTREWGLITAGGEISLCLSLSLSLSLCVACLAISRTCHSQ